MQQTEPVGPTVQEPIVQQASSLPQFIGGVNQKQTSGAP
jgi:hypothetical protein